VADHPPALRAGAPSISVLESAPNAGGQTGRHAAAARAAQGAPTDPKAQAGDEVATERSAESERAETLAPAASGALAAQKQLALAQRMVNKLQAAEVSAQAVREQVLRAGDLGTRVALQTQAPTAKGGELALVAPLSLGVAEPGLRPSERRSEKAAQRQALGEVGAWAGTAQADGARLDVPVAAGAMGASPQMQLAEQVSYWIGRGVQNAELEMSGLGEGPVKVSIALQGQEAQVDFQTDQVHTRQLLEDSMPHLREMLQREGLVLSGMSVGGSGAQGTGGKPPQARQGGRQAVVAVAELQAQAALAGSMPSRLSGRSVDLFV